MMELRVHYPFSDKHTKKRFQGDVVSLYIPNNRGFLDVAFLYTINGVHDEFVSLPNGGWKINKR